MLPSMPVMHFLPLIVLYVCDCHASFLLPLLEKHHHKTFRKGYSFVGMNKLESAMEDLSLQFQPLGTAGIQKLLVEKGVKFDKLANEKFQEHDSETLESPMERVPGCISNVKLQTKIGRSLRQSSANSEWVCYFHGTADSLISKGLMAVLVTALSSGNTEEILALQPNQVADALNIRPALSPGRNDGLASMVEVVQAQIQRLLQAQNGKTKEPELPPLYVEEQDHRSKVISEPLEYPSPNDLQRQEVSYANVAQDGSKQPTVALLLSGGVDSSVALNLLKRQNYNVTAFYLKIWLEDELAHLGQCPWEDDLLVCQEVCRQAQVPLETWSLQEEYKERVISYTIEEAQKGRTPNPDVLCNSRIKFGCFYDAIESRDFDYVASGHYARLEAVDEQVNSNEPRRGPVRLLRAPDPVKDQSYFLCALNQDQLQRVLFPIGHLEKSQVRQLAEEFQLPNRHRPDSQGLCFLGKVKFEDFLSSYLGERTGDIVDASTGELLGRHMGIWYHTVGQRKGIGKVLNPLATSRGPWYVVAKDPEKDLVFCSNQYDEAIFASARSEFHVEDIHWILDLPSNMDNGVGRFEMKIRHGPRLVEGTLTMIDSSSGTVKLDKKDGGLAPGQYVVFYNGEDCLGGGVISERHWARFLTDHNEKTAFNQSVAV